MNDESRVIAEDYDYTAASFYGPDPARPKLEPVPEIPEYLHDTYWWAYLHPKSFYFFEREWVVNLILWGNMRKLTESVLREMTMEPSSRVLQVACVYGEFSNLVAAHLSQSGSNLDLVDVAPIQLENAKKKLAANSNIGYHHQDSSALTFADDSFEQTVVFFLLHEQPEDVRRKTVEQAIRVTKPGGKVIFVDYHGPKKSNPMRYVMKPVLTLLEPFAMDLWREELPAFMPEFIHPEQLESKFYFGGLYQKIVLTV